MKRFALILGLLLPAFPARGENIRLTVVHTNDIHGWTMSQPDRKEPERRVGGAGAFANLVKAHRAKKTPVLLLDGGDWFQGTPEGTLSAGTMLAEVFNELKYDAVVVGNHDFDLGEAALKDLVAKMEFPVLGSNVYAQAAGRVVDYLKPSILREVAGVRIGIFGLNTSHMREMSFEKNIAGLDFRDEIATARKMVGELKEAGADVIIMLTHVGFEGKGRHEGMRGDQTIAREVPGIDLIIGGHTHKAIFEPETVNGALIVQAGCYLAYGGVVSLEIDPKTKKVVSSQGTLVKLWVDQWGEDPAVSAIVARYEKEIGTRLNEVIGRSEDTMIRDYKKADAVGTWMADCMRKWTKTDIAIQNGGGVRANIYAGDLSLRNMFEVMPFDNALVTLYLPGSEVLKNLEHGVSDTPGMIELSGARLRYDPEAESGKRIRQAWVGERELDPAATYSVTVPDFVAQGGSGYDFSGASDKAAMPVLIRDVLVWCTRTYSPLHASPLDRILKN